MPRQWFVQAPPIHFLVEESNYREVMILLTQSIDCRRLNSRRHPRRLPFRLASIATQTPGPQVKISTVTIEEGMEQVERQQDKVQPDRRLRR
jgi:hypothetical protein